MLRTMGLLKSVEKKIFVFFSEHQGHDRAVNLFDAFKLNLHGGDSILILELAVDKYAEYLALWSHSCWYGYKNSIT